MEVKSPMLINFLVSKSCGVELMKNYSDEFYGPLRSNETKNDFMSPLNLVISVIGLLIVLCTSFQSDKEKDRNQLWLLLKSPVFKEFIYVVSCLLASVIFLPFALLIGATFKIYREYIRHLLMNDKSKQFVSLMQGEDLIWVCEDEKSKSIINVLAFVNCKNEINENLPSQLLQSIRERIYAKLMLPNPFPKLFYRRQRDSSGYFYWTKENNLTVNEYVRYLDSSPSTESIDEEIFKRKMSLICNDPLPADNSALWECLISKQAIKCDEGGDIKYPVRININID